MTTITKLSARASYAFSLYRASVNTLGHLAAYKRACELAGCTLTDRVSLRLVLSA